MRNNYSCKSEFVWNVHLQVTLKVISISVLNMHELVETWLPEALFYEFPDWQSNVYFPWPNELTICSDINGFQIPVKTSCTGHRWCETKDFFVFCSGKNCLVCFHGFLFFCFICRLCLVHKINAQTPITAILSTYLIHEFLVNVKCRMDGSHRKPYICLSFDFLIQYSASGTCLTSVNMHKYVTSLWLLWRSYIFPDLYWNSLTWLMGND